MKQQPHWSIVLLTVKDLTIIGIVITTMFHLPYYYERLTHSYTNRAYSLPSIHYGGKYARDVYQTSPSVSIRY